MVEYSYIVSFYVMDLWLSTATLFYQWNSSMVEYNYIVLSME